MEIFLDYVHRHSRTAKAEKSDPLARDKAYIIGILQRRCSYLNYPAISNLIEAAVSWDVPVASIQNCAKSATSYSKFVSLVVDLIDDAKAVYGTETDA